MDRRSRRSPPRAAPVAGGGREDLWSDDSTEALIEAWGDRHLQLGRGSLRKKDWEEVSDAVNTRRREGGKFRRRTDSQCKNRIDSLKKKYRIQKAMLGPSRWRFFSRLDELFGDGDSAPSGVQRERSPPPRASKLKRRASPNPNHSSAAASGGGDGGGAVDVFVEMARAVGNFVDVYERVEKLKQEKMMELEREKMELMKKVQLRTMEMFMEAQLKLEKMKQLNESSSLQPPGPFVSGAGYLMSEIA